MVFKKIAKKIGFNTKPAFILLLAAISIIGFGVAALKNFNIIDISSWLTGITTILLGTALIVESNIKKAVKGKKDVEKALHLLTGLIGFAVLIGGILSIPLLGVTIPSTLSSVVGIANVGAIIVIVYELFM